MEPINSNVSVMVRLDFRNRNLNELSNQELKNYGDNLEYLDFSNNNIKTLSEGLFDDFIKMTHLYFSENLLEIIPSKLFHKLSKLKHLDMSHNKLTILNYDHLINLTELRQFKLYKNSLTNLDINTFKSFAPSLEYLDISNNKLEQLELHIFDSMTNLKHLIIHTNSLVKLQQNHFDHLVKLEYLDISNNKLNHLESHIFDLLSNLKDLRFHTNQIDKVDNLQFKNLVKLEYLDFSSNKIVDLDEDLFERLSQLKKLKIHHNCLRNPKSKIFRNLFQLESLNLSHNEIHNIHENLFESLGNLKRLDLSSNQLFNDLKPKSFSSLKCLEYLNFSSNKIVGLNKNLFDECIKLKRLLFNNNEISSLKPALFSKLQDLEYLQFSNNNCETLGENLFESLHKLDRLEFSNNQVNEIKVGLFKNLVALEQLTFSKNRIKILNYNTFNNLVNLKYLNINSNEIAKFESDLFKSTKKLTVLILSNNMVENMDSDSLFENLTELTCLNLNNNLIGEIQSENIFKDLRKLKILALSNNRLKFVHKDLFQHLDSLEFLNLSSNNLAMNTFDLFEKLSNLNSLILFNNKLEKLDVKACIENLKKLEFLDLSSNLIRELCYENVNQAKGQSCLRELFLNDNKINSIHNEFFAKIFPNLKTLELSRNELDHWDFKYLANKNTKLYLYGNSLDVKIIRKKMKHIIPNYSTITNGYLDCFSHPNFIKWENIPMLSIVTGVNGVGKTSLLKTIQNQLEQQKSTTFPLFLKVHDAIVCHDENNFVKSNSNKIDKYKFDHVDTQAFLKLRQSGTSVLSLASIEMCLIFLKSDIINEKINDHLIKRFKYGLKWIKETNSFNLFNNSKSNTQTLLEINNLSPGEQLILLFLLWQYIYKKFKVNGKTVLLFDEPDAHLHPALVKSFLKILTELVELGVQVIMTTHNPTTVSLAANENLFHLECDQSEKKILKKVTRKNEAINLLTENFLYVSEPVKIVFTEGKGNDNLFFNNLKRIYFQNQNQKGASFIFRSIGSCEFKYFFEKETINKEGNFDQTEKIFLGIIDGDKDIIRSYEYFIDVAERSEFAKDFDIKILQARLMETQKNLKKFNENLLRLERYSIENYIYDPINIFFSLKNGPKQNFLVFPPEFDEYMKKDSLSDFLNKKNLKLKQKEKILNEILAITAKRLIQFFEQESSFTTILSESLKNQFGLKYNDLNKILDTCQRLPTYDKFKLVFAMNNHQHVINLKYNPLLIFLKGHTIESIFNREIKFLENANGKPITWHEKLVIDNNAGFLFTNDLKEIMEILVKE